MATSLYYNDNGTPVLLKAGEDGITVDSALSGTSTNPVQNKVVKAALDGKAAASTLTALSNTIDNSVLPAVGVPRNNLGSPSVFEAAIIDSEFDNKVWFMPPEDVLFETSNDGVTFVVDEAVTTDKKKALMAASSSYYANIAMPKGKFARVTLRASSYVYLNALYMYTSGAGARAKILIEKQTANTEDDSWVVVNNWAETGLGWPGHTLIRHSNIPFSRTGNYSHRVRVTIEVLSQGDLEKYPNATLYTMAWYGGYPVGKRTIYSWDTSKNVTFPANITATRFIGLADKATADGNGANIASTYAKKADVPTPSVWHTTVSAAVAEGAAFTVPTHVVNSAIVVYWNGLELQKTTHFTDNSTTSLKFTFPLAVGDEVSVVTHG